MNTPNYIRSLLTPQARKPNGRRIWSIVFEQVWLPFFTATNVMGDTSIPSEALGCPLRLGYDKTGAVKFSATGRPVIRVAKEIGESVRLVRDNFTANLMAYAGQVINEHTEDYKAQIELARKAGEPILAHDKEELDKANTQKAVAQAEAIAEAKAKAEAQKEAVPA